MVELIIWNFKTVFWKKPGQRSGCLVPNLVSGGTVSIYCHLTASPNGDPVSLLTRSIASWEWRQCRGVINDNILILTFTSSSSLDLIAWSQWSVDNEIWGYCWLDTHLIVRCNTSPFSCQGQWLMEPADDSWSQFCLTSHSVSSSNDPTLIFD